MPSFDVVSEVNHHELSNGIDQANREVVAHQVQRETRRLRAKKVFSRP